MGRDQTLGDGVPFNCMEVAQWWRALDSVFWQVLGNSFGGPQGSCFSHSLCYLHIEFQAIQGLHEALFGRGWGRDSAYLEAKAPETTLNNGLGKRDHRPGRGDSRFTPKRRKPGMPLLAEASPDTSSGAYATQGPRAPSPTPSALMCLGLRAQ